MRIDFVMQPFYCFIPKLYSNCCPIYPGVLSQHRINETNVVYHLADFCCHFANVSQVSGSQLEIARKMLLNRISLPEIQAANEEKIVNPDIILVPERYMSMQSKYRLTYRGHGYTRLMDSN